MWRSRRFLFVCFPCISLLFFFIAYIWKYLLFIYIYTVDIYICIFLSTRKISLKKKQPARIRCVEYCGCVMLYGVGWLVGGVFELRTIYISPHHMYTHAHWRPYVQQKMEYIIVVKFNLFFSYIYAEFLRMIRTITHK